MIVYDWRGMSVSMVLAGDFNISVDDWDKLKKYLRNYFNLEFNTDLAQKTTVNGIFVDNNFSRYKRLICKPYVS